MDNRLVIQNRRQRHQRKLYRRMSKKLAGKVIPRQPRVKTLRRFATPSSAKAAFISKFRPINQKAVTRETVQEQMHGQCRSADGDVDTSFCNSEDDADRVWFNENGKLVPDVRPKDEDTADESIILGKMLSERLGARDVLDELEVYEANLETLKRFNDKMSKLASRLDHSSYWQKIFEDTDSGSETGNSTSEDASDDGDSNPENASNGGDQEQQEPMDQDSSRRATQPPNPIDVYVAENNDDHAQMKVFVEFDQVTVNVIIDETLYFIRARAAHGLPDYLDYKHVNAAKLRKLLAYWTIEYQTTDWDELMGILKMNIMDRVPYHMDWCPDSPEMDWEGLGRRDGETAEHYWARSLFKWMRTHMNHPEVLAGREMMVVGESTEDYVQSRQGLSAAWMRGPMSPDGTGNSDGDANEDEGQN